MVSACGCHIKKAAFCSHFVNFNVQFHTAYFWNTCSCMCSLKQAFIVKYNKKGKENQLNRQNLKRILKSLLYFFPFASWKTLFLNPPILLTFNQGHCPRRTKTGINKEGRKVKFRCRCCCSLTNFEFFLTSLARG